MSSHSRSVSSESSTRTTVRLPKDLDAAIDAAVDDGEYPNRSEAIRTAIENELTD